MPILMEINKLNKSFGGLAAIQNLSFHVEEGEISSIIGPNGAGKTTLFNLITGYHKPDSGEILYQGKPLQKLLHYQIVRMGVGRAFQRCNIFSELSVFENVRVAVISRQRKSYDLFRHAPGMPEVKAEVFHILEDIGMADKAGHVSGTLSHGDQKRLDIGIALALRPKMLLLDEPTAGMSPEERNRMVQLVQKLWKDWSLALVFIEHDMDVGFSISQKIRVLYYGQLLAEGVPEEIAKNEKVIEAYLGTDEDE
jgi:branched-chain amino acid transport system ATP-binding protein